MPHEVAGGKTRFEVFQGENRWTKNTGPKQVSYFHIGKAVQNDSPKLMEQIAFQEFSQKVMQDDCKFTKLLSKSELRELNKSNKHCFDKTRFIPRR